MRLTFEQSRQPLISRRRFVGRLARAMLLWLGMTAVGLLIGMAGYAITEGWGPTDAFVNAAMILSGMGPIQPLATTAGKIFAGIYAILSGLFVVVATGFVLAPILHRVLHAFHIERNRADN